MSASEKCPLVEVRLYDPKDKKRELIFEKLCCYGNFNHNMSVLEMNEVPLKVVWCPPVGMKMNPDDYLPCKYCYGFFLGEWGKMPV